MTPQFHLHLDPGQKVRLQVVQVRDDDVRHHDVLQVIVDGGVLHPVTVFGAVGQFDHLSWAGVDIVPRGTVVQTEPDAAEPCGCTVTRACADHVPTPTPF